MKQLIVLAALSLILLTDAKDLRSQGKDDLERQLRDLIEPSEELICDICEAQYVKVGCYRDKRHNRVLNELLFTDRSLQSPESSGNLIDWVNYKDYLKNFTCRCAEASKAKGYTHFGLQYYGECFSSLDASQVYDNLGISSACVNSSLQPCNAEDAQECVGKGNTNFIYRIPKDGSSGVQVDDMYIAFDAA